MPHFPVPAWKDEIKYNLENITLLLRALGNLQLNLPPVIHIAGTNGKGSSVAILRSIFESANYKVHTYTSPHLCDFNERIVLGGEKISDAELFEVCEHVRLASIDNNVTPSFFEGVTAAAFLAFAASRADILILETGLGGRLDATNVVPHPIITLITPISYDHMQQLGDTLPLIAQEKAGIIKQGAPCVISAQTQEVYDVLLAKAHALKAPAFCYEYDFGVKKTDNGFLYFSHNITYEFPSPILRGDHQLINAASCIACISLINQQFNINSHSIARGLQNAIWPARIQKIDPARYQKFANNNIQIWIDGAHNNAGAQVLATWMSENLVPPIYLILGMTKNRNIEEFCGYFSELTTKGYGVKVLSEPLSYDADAIVAKGGGAGIIFSNAASLEDAIVEINQLHQNEAVNIVITGSLFLAADFFKIIGGV